MSDLLDWEDEPGMDYAHANWDHSTRQGKQVQVLRALTANQHKARNASARRGKLAREARGRPNAPITLRDFSRPTQES